MTDTRTSADSAQARGRPGAGALLADQMDEAGERRQKRRDIRPLARLWPYLMRHKVDAAIAGFWLILSTVASLARSRRRHRSGMRPRPRSRQKSDLDCGDPG